MNTRPDASSRIARAKTTSRNTRVAPTVPDDGMETDNAAALSFNPARTNGNMHARSNEAPDDHAEAESAGAFPLIDRRLGLDRRLLAGGDSSDDSTGLERRRGAGRRRTDFLKAADEGELTPEQFMFLMAIDAFKKSNDRMYPTWSDVLEVIRLMGYRKTMPSELNLRNAEDWREGASTPSGVKAKQGKREAA